MIKLEKKSSSVCFAVNGEAEHVDFIVRSVTAEEEEESQMGPSALPVTAPLLVPVIHRVISSCVRSASYSTSCWYVTTNREVTGLCHCFPGAAHFISASDPRLINTEVTNVKI